MLTGCLHWLKWNRRIYSFIGIFLCLLFLSGCVYMRLLEFKKQLAKFEENFWTEVQDGFVLHFKNPMIFDKDVSYLSKVDPSSVEKEIFREDWVYRFKKTDEKNNMDSTGPDFGIVMTFKNERKLTTLKFSEEFLEIIPPKFMELSLRALGSAKVDTKKRQLDAESLPISRKDFVLPKRGEVMDKLGMPAKIETENDVITLIYHYRLIGTFPKDGKDDRGKATTTLQFDHRTDEMIKAQGRFAGLKISIDYKKWREKVVES